MQCSERLLSHSQILYSTKSRKKQAPYTRFQLIRKSNRKNSFLQLGLLTRFQHVLYQAGAGERARVGEIAGAGKVAHLTWEVVMGSSRMFEQLKAPADWKHTKPKLEPGL